MILALKASSRWRIWYPHCLSLQFYASFDNFGIFKVNFDCGIVVCGSLMSFWMFVCADFYYM